MWDTDALAGLVGPSVVARIRGQHRIFYDNRRASLSAQSGNFFGLLFGNANYPVGSLECLAFKHFVKYDASVFCGKATQKGDVACAWRAMPDSPRHLI